MRVTRFRMGVEKWMESAEESAAAAGFSVMLNVGGFAVENLTFLGKADTGMEQRLK